MTTIRSVMLCGFEFWAIKKERIQKMNVAEMRILRWMSGSIHIENIHGNLEVALIEDQKLV